ncbi:hypothetical protein DPSP01_009920 [Paraphaeosphaeria sporulosa]
MKRAADFASDREDKRVRFEEDADSSKAPDKGNGRALEYEHLPPNQMMKLAQGKEKKTANKAGDKTIVNKGKDPVSAPSFPSNTAVFYGDPAGIDLVTDHATTPPPAPAAPSEQAPSAEAFSIDGTAPAARNAGAGGKASKVKGKYVASGRWSWK